MENKINAEDLVKNQDIDASRWAAAFMQIFGSDLRQIDEGLMISWFANSIMVTHDKISNEKDAAVEQLKADLRMSDLNRQSLWVDSLKLVDENAALKSKLKIATEAIEKYTDLHHAPKLEETLKEIGGEI